MRAKPRQWGGMTPYWALVKAWWSEHAWQGTTDNSILKSSILSINFLRKKQNQLPRIRSVFSFCNSHYLEYINQVNQLEHSLHQTTITKWQIIVLSDAAFFNFLLNATGDKTRDRWPKNWNMKWGYLCNKSHWITTYWFDQWVSWEALGTPENRVFL